MVNSHMWLVATRLGRSDHRIFPLGPKVPLDVSGLEGWRFRTDEMRMLDSGTVQEESIGCRDLPFPDSLPVRGV